MSAKTNFSSSSELSHNFRGKINLTFKCTPCTQQPWTLNIVFPQMQKLWPLSLTIYTASQPSIRYMHFGCGRRQRGKSLLKEDSLISGNLSLKMKFKCKTLPCHTVGWDVKQMQSLVMTSIKQEWTTNVKSFLDMVQCSKIRHPRVVLVHV